MAGTSNSAPKTAAERQRLRRERRRQGVRCVVVHVSAEAVSALEAAGLLDDEDLATVLSEVIEESAVRFSRDNGNGHA